MDPFHNDGKRHAFFQLLPFEKRSTTNVPGQKYYNIIELVANWLDFLVNFLKLIW
jgi:hypothetical protein